MNDDRNYFENMMFSSVSERIKRSLINMNTKNAYYNTFFLKNNINIENITDYSSFSKMPFMDKDIYRNNMEQFNSCLINKEYVTYNTSGSSGTPIKVYRSREDEMMQNYILCKYRNNRCGDIMYKKWAFLYYTYTSNKSRNNRSIVKLTDNSVRYNYFYINDESMEDMFNYLKEYMPSWIVGSVSAIYNLSNYIKRKKKSDIKFNLEYIECTSEYLFPEQRKLISEVFSVKPVSLYGSIEVNAIGYECECGNMHVIPENVFVEIESNNDSPKGEVIVTSLANKYTPLLRYKQGDTAEWGESPCKCKFSSPYLKLTGFRNNDYLRKKDGTKIEMWFVNDIIKYIEDSIGLNIKQFTIVQKDYNYIEFTILMENIDYNLTKSLEGIFNMEMSNIFNETVVVKYVYVDSLISSDSISGKFKYFISHVL